MIAGLLYKDMCVEGNLIQYSHIKITVADNPLTFMISPAIYFLANFTSALSWSEPRMNSESDLLPS